MVLMANKLSKKVMVELRKDSVKKTLKIYIQNPGAVVILIWEDKLSGMDSA
jgi:hypothetical protein